MQLSKNFSLRELTYTKEKDLLAENIYYAMGNFEKLQELAIFAQKIRDLLDTPMTVSSAVRCPELNIRKNGSTTSQHCKVEAIDFITKKMDLNAAFKKIRESDIKFGQLIIEEDKNGSKWIHISIGTKCQVLEYKNGKYSRI